MCGSGSWKKSVNREPADIVACIGLADVKKIGMCREDCEDFLPRLGYRVSVTVSETK